MGKWIGHDIQLSKGLLENEALSFQSIHRCKSILKLFLFYFFVKIHHLNILTENVNLIYIKKGIIYKPIFFPLIIISWMIFFINQLLFWHVFKINFESLDFWLESKVDPFVMLGGKFKILKDIIMNMWCFYVGHKNIKVNPS
jgi:hypothetical protein